MLMIQQGSQCSLLHIN